MAWHESNASVRKHFQVKMVVLFFVLTAVVLLSVVALETWVGTLTHFSFKILLFLPVILIIYLINWFSSGPEVRLTEVCVIRAAGKSGSRTNYDEIENCTVHTDDYKGKKLSFFEIKLKDKSKFRINSPVEKFIVPEDVNLNQVLKNLRDKGVNVIQGKLPS